MSDFLNFLDFLRLSNLVKQKTWYKDPDNPSCINLILANCHRSFQNSNVFETGLFYFHEMIVSVLNSHFSKQKPNILEMIINF